MRDRWIVLTTINPPTAAVERISRLCEQGWSAVVIGDTKTPTDWHATGITFLSVADQRLHFGPLADAIPFRHYARKNLGYLYAINQGAELILETDDDNLPYETFGCDLQRAVKGRLIHGPGWVNIYSHFAPTNKIWPRGLPLDAIDNIGTETALTAPLCCPIQQYLVDNDPDVDAIYRLTQKAPVHFQEPTPVVVTPRTWTPFNSQNTLFFREAFALLYLPSHVSFRMTDIWRSFVAQAALWHQGWSLAYQPATAEQVRNSHNLMRDFADEVDGYLRNREIAEVLERSLGQAGTRNLSETALYFWQALHGIGIIPASEMAILHRWFQAVQQAAALGEQCALKWAKAG
jgi:hypothetical protein